MKKILIHTGLNDSYGLAIPDLVAGTGFVDIFTADLNGLQEEKIIKVNNIINGSADEITFNVYGDDGFGGIKTFYTRKYSFPSKLTNNSGIRSVVPKYYYTGDFNGDGKAEILVVSAHMPFGNSDVRSQWYLFDLENDEVLFQEEIFPFYIGITGENDVSVEMARNTTDKLLVGDFDGDGKSELFHVSASGSQIYTFKDGDNGIVCDIKSTNAGLNRSLVANRELYSGDFNGDGVTDYALSPASQTANKTWRIGISKGHGIFLNSSTSICTANQEEGCGQTFIDINSDGISDLVDYNKDGFTCYILSPNWKVSETINHSYSEPNRMLVPANVNSHNFSSILTSISNNTVIKYAFDRDDSLEVLLTGMINSLGAVEENEYRNIKAHPSPIDAPYPTEYFYTIGKDATFPYVNIQENIPVIFSNSKKLNNQIISKEIFSYKNAVLHKQGHGFCGFEEINSTDLEGNISTTCFLPYEYGQVSYQKTKDAEIIYENDIKADSNKLLHRQIKKAKVKDLSILVESSSSYTYDIYDNIIKEVTEYSDNIHVTKLYNYYTNAVLNNGYYSNYRIEESETRVIGNDTYQKTIKITKHQKGKPLETIEIIDGNVALTKTFQYDSNGNMTYEDETLYDSSNSLAQSYEYNEKGKMIKKTDYYGHTEEYTYDVFGRKNTQTDKRGNVISFGYDNLNRLKNINYPDGTNEQYIRSWSTKEDELYCIKHSDRNSHYTTKSYDALNREVRILDSGIRGRKRYIDKIYDNRGRIIKESSPYVSVASTWKETVYDNLDRPIHVTDQDGKKFVTIYEKDRTVTIANGTTVYRYYNSLGDLYKIEDASGVVIFYLRADSQPVCITAPGNVNTIIEYDKYRRRIKLVDPSSGSTTFSYDENGNQSSCQMAGNGNTVTCEYDEYNRLVKKNIANETIIYAYNDYGDIISETSSSGTSRLTEYDVYGRIESITDVGIDGKFLSRQYSYNLNEISEIKYSYNNREFIEKYQYSYGHIISVKLDNQDIFKIVGENEPGQITAIQTGPVKRTYNYSLAGIVLSRKSYIGDTLIQNLEYSYSTNSTTISSRQMDDIAESFTYDNLNRLIRMGNSRILYDVKGNILSKDGVGTFSYSNSSNPYRITTAVIQDGLISDEDFKISYSRMGRVITITEGDYSARFTYNHNNDRTKMVIYKTSQSPLNSLRTRYYLGNCLEIDEIYSPKTKLYLMGDYYDSPVVQVSDKNGDSLIYVLRDNLGSITHVVAEDGTIKQHLSYDAWGRMRNPITGAYYVKGTEPILYLGRGFSGHEHITEFNIINMNARLYDPILGRFDSPDPHIQNPELSQNFNRYAYALNNPLSYRDKNGEFFLFTALTAVVDLFKNLFTRGVNFHHYNWKQTRNAFKIDIGVFKGNFGQILNKLTWGGLSTIGGKLIAHGANLVGKVDRVSDLDGMLALSGVTTGSKAFTVGPYSMGPANYQATWKDNLFVHEYGHYIQAQRFGPFYYQVIAIPSLLSAAGTSEWAGMDHDHRWFEVDASYNGAKYFDRKYGSGAAGYTYKNPNYFDRETFESKYYSLYPSNRSAFYNNYDNPTSGSKLVFWDFIF